MDVPQSQHCGLDCHTYLDSNTVVQTKVVPTNIAQTTEVQLSCNGLGKQSLDWCWLVQWSMFPAVICKSFFHSWNIKDHGWITVCYSKPTKISTDMIIHPAGDHEIMSKNNGNIIMSINKM